MRTTAARAATAVVLAGMAGLSLGACSSSSSSTAAKTAPATANPPGFTVVSPVTRGSDASTTGSANPASTTTPASGTPLRYKKIVEPFSPPGTCQDDGTALEMTACVLEQIVDVDSTIDTLQATRFESAPESQQAAMLAEYARWLKGRATTCNETAKSGGTIDQINVAQCLLQASQDRVETLNAVQN